MLNKRSKVTTRFVLTISAAFSILIIIFSLFFFYMLQTNSNILKNTIIKNNNLQILNKVKIITDRIKEEEIKSTRKLAHKLYKYCSEDNDFLNIIIFSKTSDENYFKVRRKISLNPILKIKVKKNHIVQEGKTTNYLKSGLFKTKIDPKIYSSNNHYYQNIYYPFKIKNKNFVIEFTVSSSKVITVLNEYSNKISKIKKYSLVVIVAVIVIVIFTALIFIYRYSLLINNLSKNMKEAAEGKLDINLNLTEDDDLNELALSFNSIVTGLKELKKKDKIIQELESKESLGDLFKLGVDILKEKNYDDAISIFNTLTILKPNAFGSYFNLGVAYAKKKDYSTSRDMFEKALEHNSNHTLTADYIEKVKKLQMSYERLASEHKG